MDIIEVTVDEGFILNTDQMSERLFYEIVERIELLFSIYCFDVRPQTSSWRKCLSYFLFVTASLINIYYAIFFFYVLLTNDGDTRTVAALNTFIHVIFAMMSSTAVFFLHCTQRSEALKEFADKLSQAYQIREKDEFHSQSLRKLCRFFTVAVAVNTLYGGTFIISYIFGLRPAAFNHGSARMTQMFGNEEIFVVYLAALIYLFIGWNIAIMLYVMCTMASKYSLERLHEEIERVDGDSLEVVISSISDIIKKHSLISEAVNSFNDNVKRFAFIQLALSVPCTLCTLFLTISQRRAPLHDIILITPSLIIALYGFLCIAYFPAELHETSCKTRSIFCGNLRIWLPYREKVYSSGLMFLSYIDHSEVGISAWGFATLSRPAILTTLSVMMTLLALLFQIRGCSPAHI